MFVLTELNECVWPGRVTVFNTFEQAEDEVHLRLAEKGQQLKSMAGDPNTQQVQFFTEGESHNSYLIQEAK